MSRVQLTGIWLYPVKSLDGESVEQARVTAGGSLEFDRRWAILDGAGYFVNGKRNREVHEIRSSFDFRDGVIRLTRGKWVFAGSPPHAAQWISEQLGLHVVIEENTETGFADDTDSPGPTVISEATLTETASWFGLDAAQMRARLRPNLVIDGVPPFGEDRLFGAPGTLVPFRIGDVTLEGNNPCQRCVVPTRDPVTGEEHIGFQKLFATRREATLPEWSHRERFNHYYRASVNTLIPAAETGKILRVGDEVIW